MCLIGFHPSPLGIHAQSTCTFDCPAETTRSFVAYLQVIFDRGTHELDSGFLSSLESNLPIRYNRAASAKCDSCRRRVTDAKLVFDPYSESLEEYYDIDFYDNYDGLTYPDIRIFAPSDHAVFRLELEQTGTCDTAFSPPASTITATDVSLSQSSCPNGFVSTNVCCCSCSVEDACVSIDDLLVVFNEPVVQGALELEPVAKFSGTTREETFLLNVCTDIALEEFQYEDFFQTYMSVYNQMAVENCLAFSILDTFPLQVVSSIQDISCLLVEFFSENTPIFDTGIPTVAPTSRPTFPPGVTASPTDELVDSQAMDRPPMAMEPMQSGGFCIYFGCDDSRRRHLGKRPPPRPISLPSTSTLAHKEKLRKLSLTDEVLPNDQLLCPTQRSTNLQPIVEADFFLRVNSRLVSSGLPSIVSVFDPGNEPTRIPTASPTTPPTQIPTSIPTKQPTSFPSASPTAKPTELPTIHPTKQPTSSPSIPLAPSAKGKGMGQTGKGFKGNSFKGRDMSGMTGTSKSMMGKRKKPKGIPYGSKGRAPNKGSGWVMTKKAGGGLKKTMYFKSP